MEIRVWQSYSCNNSSSFRLVARFGDPSIASDAATELTQFFKTHAKQADKQSDDGIDFDNWPPPPTQACVDFGKKHGFQWKEWLGWGDDSQVGDEPEVVAADKTLVVYHSYCSELPNEIAKYLKARGATSTKEDEDAPEISVLFKLPKEPKESQKLARSLGKLFGQAKDTNQDIDEWETKPPWSGGDQADAGNREVGFFNDGKLIGFHLPIYPKQIEKLKKYLAKNGVDNPTLTLCEPANAKKFRAIGSARCDSCGTQLSYLDPTTHKIETEQLGCDKCGGMYDLATVAKAAAAAEKKAERAAAKAAEKAAEEAAAAEAAAEKAAKAAKRKSQSAKKKTATKTKTTKTKTTKKKSGAKKK